MTQTQVHRCSGPNDAGLLETPETCRLKRWRAGDLSGFDELMAQHQDRIYRLCLWYLGDSEAALDATQEVFIRAFRHIQKFRGDCSFITWLHRIAVNTASQQAKHRKRVPVPLSTLQTCHSPFLEPADLSDGPAATVARRERRLAVHSALATLPEHHRLVVLLFDIQGHSYEEIAQILELPRGTVKSRLNRARTGLREKLEPYRELF